MGADFFINKGTSGSIGWGNGGSSGGSGGGSSGGGTGTGSGLAAATYTMPAVAGGATSYLALASDAHFGDARTVTFVAHLSFAVAAGVSWVFAIDEVTSGGTLVTTHFLSATLTGPAKDDVPFSVSRTNSSNTLRFRLVNTGVTSSAPIVITATLTSV